MPNGRPITPEQRDRFLQHLEETGHVAHSAEKAGLSRRSLYRVRLRNKTFAAQWKAAEEMGLDALQDEIMRRAKDGTTRSVYYQGLPVGSVTEYSNDLAMFILKSKRPETYGDRHAFQHLDGQGNPTDPPRLVINLRVAGQEPVTIDHENAALLLKKS